MDLIKRSTAFLWRNRVNLLLGMLLGAVLGLASVAVGFAIEIIDPPENAPAWWAPFFKNVGYSVSAGGLILALVELSRLLWSSVRKGSD